MPMRASRYIVLRQCTDHGKGVRQLPAAHGLPFFLAGKCQQRVRSQPKNAARGKQSCCNNARLFLFPPFCQKQSACCCCKSVHVGSHCLCRHSSFLLQFFFLFCFLIGFTCFLTAFMVGFIILERLSILHNRLPRLPCLNHECSSSFSASAYSVSHQPSHLYCRSTPPLFAVASSCHPPQLPDVRSFVPPSALDYTTPGNSLIRMK